MAVTLSASSSGSMLIDWPARSSETLVMTAFEVAIRSSVGMSTALSDSTALSGLPEIGVSRTEAVA